MLTDKLKILCSPVNVSRQLTSYRSRHTYMFWNFPKCCRWLYSKRMASNIDCMYDANSRVPRCPPRSPLELRGTLTNRMHSTLRLTRDTQTACGQCFFVPQVEHNASRDASKMVVLCNTIKHHVSIPSTHWWGKKCRQPLSLEYQLQNTVHPGTYETTSDYTGKPVMRNALDP